MPNTKILTPDAKSATFGFDMPASIILDLCGGTGSWSAPYREAGYDVRLVTLPEHDVRNYVPPPNVLGILAAPPCTEFSRAGARWWPHKPARLLQEAVDTVCACLTVVAQCKPTWWALENPIGRIQACVPELGDPRLKCNPCDYGDPWTKRMWIWGNFEIPKTNKVIPVFAPGQPPRSRDRTSMLSSSQKVERARTSAAFARAFFEANP